MAAARSGKQGEARSTAKQGPPSADLMAGVLAAARVGADHVESGGFKLDRGRALEKIKRFKLADPNRYVLELVQAAVASGASAIDIALDADDLVLTFDGQACSDRELHDLLDHTFARQANRQRLRALAVGLITGLTLNPSALTVESGDGASGWILRVRALDDMPVAAMPEPRTGTRIHFRERLSWKVIAETFGRANPEEAILREACVHTPVPIALNGQDLRRPLAAHADVRVSIEAAGMRGEVSLCPTPEEATYLALCMNGVRIVVRHLPESAGICHNAGLSAWIDNPLLSRDASHADIIADAELERTLAALEDATRRLYRAWLREVLIERPRTPGEAEDPVFLAHCRRAAVALLRHADAHKLPPEVTQLIDVEGLVQLPFGEHTSSLRPFWRNFDRKRIYLVANRQPDLEPSDLPPGTVIARRVKPTRELLAAVFGRGNGKTANKRLTRLKRRKLNRLAAEALRREPVLSPHLSLVRAPLLWRDPDMRGEVGLSHAVWAGTPTLKVTLLRDGVPLERDLAVSARFHGSAVVECPDFQPKEMWDGIERSASFHRALARLGSVGPELLEALSEAFPEPPPCRTLAALHRWSARNPRGTDLPRPGGWVDNAAQRMARRHLEQLLAASDAPSPLAAPHLMRWRFLHTLAGEATALENLLADQDARLRYVVRQPWGPAPDDAIVALDNGPVLDWLRRHLGDRLQDVTAELTGWRDAQAAEVEAAEAARRNRERAIASRQPPLLQPPEDYLAIVDLPGCGPGQVGVPRQGDDSFLRYLVDGMPLCQDPIRSPIPLHAVTGSPHIRPDPSFSWFLPTPEVENIRLEVMAQTRPLVEQLAAAAQRRPGRAQELLRAFVLDLSGRGQRAVKAWADTALWHTPLFSSASHGLLSLADLAAEARAEAVLWTLEERTAVVTEKRVLVAPLGVAKRLARMFACEEKDYSDALQRQLKSQAWLTRPAERPVLGETVALKWPFREGAVSGEVGFPVELSNEVMRKSSPLRVLKGGRFVQLRRLSWHRLPLEAVVDGPDLELDASCTTVVAGPRWDEVLKVVKAACEDLASSACARLDQLAGQPRASVTLVLQALALRLFHRSPSILSGEMTGLSATVAAAPIWPTVDGRHLSLLDLDTQLEREGHLLVTGRERGHPTSGTQYLSTAHDLTGTALKGIFGELLRDGTEALDVEEAAWRRQRYAVPVSSLSAYDVLGVHPFSLRHGDLEVTGEVGPAADYDAQLDEIVVRVAIQGKLLAQIAVPHPIRGHAVVHCQGLVVSEDWSGLADGDQRAAIETQVQRAMWAAVDDAVGGWTAALGRRRLTDLDVARAIPGDLAMRRLVLDALRACGDPASAVPRLPALTAAPVFETVDGIHVTADALLAQSERAEVAFIPAELPGGRADGGLLLRLDALGQQALQALLPGRIRNEEASWRWRRRSEDGEMLRALRQRLADVLPAPVELVPFFERGDGALLSPEASAWRAHTQHPTWQACKRALAASDDMRAMDHLAAAALVPLVADAATRAAARLKLAALAATDRQP